MYDNEKVDQTEKINPWIHIWKNPRATIRSAIDNNWMNMAIILAIVVGIDSAWDNAVSNAVDSGYRSVESLPSTLIMVFIVGAIFGVLGWLIMSGIITWIGSWLGGVGTYKELLIAIGVSGIPTVFLFGLNLVDFLFIGNKLFYGGALAGWQNLWMLLTGSIALVITIWSIFISLKSIGEAHRFSAWRALATVIIPVVIIIIVAMLIGFITLLVF